MKAILPKYFDSEWSFASFKLKNSEDKAIACGFSEDGSSFRIVTRKGKFLEINIPKKGGKIKTIVSKSKLFPKPN